MDYNDPWSHYVTFPGTGWVKRRIDPLDHV